MTRLSQSVAMISLRWPQRRHISTLTEKICCTRAAQLIDGEEGADWARPRPASGRRGPSDQRACVPAGPPLGHHRPAKFA